MADSSIGEVDITLDGEVATLECSLAAAKRISAAGGYLQVASRIDAMDQSAFALVIAAGLNKRADEVENAVYRSGLQTLNDPLATFLVYLMNGGKPLKPAGDGKTGEV